MLKERVLKALSDQINAEYHSAYLYSVMSAYADRAGYKGAANWLYVQAREEMAHGVNIYRHILERGETPLFSDIKTPETAYEGVRDVFEKVLSHERRVSDLINKIASIALEENDHATYNFIAWYVKEQVEEESQADEILTKISLIGDNAGLMYNLDEDLAARQFVDPFPSGEQAN
jgi:ferritin